MEAWESKRQMSKKIVRTQVKFWKFHVYDVI